jgi:hypothetical protein
VARVLPGLCRDSALQADRAAMRSLRLNRPVSARRKIRVSRFDSGPASGRHHAAPWRSMRTCSDSRIAGQASVCPGVPPAPAADEQRAGRGAAGSRLLRWHSDSAAKLITRACSRVGGALRSRLSSDPRPRRKRETPAAWSSASPTPRRPARGRLEHAWGVFGAFALSRAVSAGPGISAIHGKLIPRNPHQGHTGSTRNDGVGGSSPPVGFGSSS